MGSHFVRWGVFTADAYAQDAVDRDKLRSLEVDILFAADAQPVPGPGLVAGIPLLRDVHLVRVDLFPIAAGTTPAQQIVTNRNLVTGHFVPDGHENDATAAGTLPLSDETQLGSATMITVGPFPYIRLSDDALAAWTVAPTLVHALVTYTDRYPEVARPHFEFGGFVDDTDDVTGVPVTSAALAAELQARTGGFTFTDQGRTLNVSDACYAAPAPTGELWLRNSQIGNNPNQIPPSASLNTPQRYTFFPAVFVRQVRGFSALTSVGPRRVAAITETLGPLLVWQVVRSPTFSRWLLILDGVPMDVIVAHPPGSDLRTPHEIWQGLWVPWLRGGASFVPIYGLNGSTGTNVFTVIGQLDRQLLAQKLDLARFLEVMDSNGVTPILTRYSQTA